MSKSRAQIFEQIIRGDPRKAIELAIPADTQEKLPLSVRKNLENWESAFVDIQSMHVCFDPKHPVGFIKTLSRFEDGRTLRTWSYGTRKRLTKLKGLAVWGVSMGEDFAMAEQPVQILPKTADSGVLKLGGNDIVYNSLAERRLLVHEIKETERRHAGIVGSVHRLKYPIALASSMSADAILTAKYELNATFVTYEEALSAAMARKRISIAN